LKAPEERKAWIREHEEKGVHVKQWMTDVKYDKCEFIEIMKDDDLEGRRQLPRPQLLPFGIGSEMVESTYFSTVQGEL
jgi:hypothetical protein